MDRDLNNLPAAVRQMYEASVAAHASATQQQSPDAADVPPVVEHGSAPVQTPAPAAPTAPAATPGMLASQKAHNNWEQAYRVLQGKYDAEVPRLHQQVSQLTAERDALRLQLTQQPAAKASTSAATHQTLSDDQIKNLVSADQIDEYGMDYWRSHFAGVAMLTQPVAAADQRLERVEQQLQATATDRFWQQLDAIAPDWQAIDQSPDFKAMLDEVEPLSGRTYGEWFSDAYNALDAGRVNQVMQMFKARKGVSKSPIESQLMPAARPTAPGTPAVGITPAQWQAEMQALINSGASPNEVTRRRQELAAQLNAGINAGPSPGGAASFV